MCGLVRTAGAFFTFYIVILATFWAMTTFFRLLGTVTVDYNVAGTLSVLAVFLWRMRLTGFDAGCSSSGGVHHHDHGHLYVISTVSLFKRRVLMCCRSWIDSGYLIPVFAMKDWLSWLYRINPINYVRSHSSSYNSNCNPSHLAMNRDSRH